jgi:soluble P-type ATPase
MKLGYTKTIAVGNGNNDILMLKKAVVGICINGLDGTTPECVSNSNIVINDVKNIANLLENENLILSILQK